MLKGHIQHIQLWFINIEKWLGVQTLDGFIHHTLRIRFQMDGKDFSVFFHHIFMKVAQTRHVAPGTGGCVCACAYICIYILRERE